MLGIGLKDLHYLRKQEKEEQRKGKSQKFQLGVAQSQLHLVQERHRFRALSVRKSRMNETFSFHPAINQVTKSLSSMRRRNKFNVHKKLYKEDRKKKAERDRVFYINKIKQFHENIDE